MCLQYVLKMLMIMLSNHAQLRAVWISPYINIILEVSLYKCTHQCCIYHLYRHLRIHSKKSASRYAVQMKVEKSRTNISSNRHGETSNG